MVYCEEAAFMPPPVFYEVVVPLMGVKRTACIMISTPVDMFNFFSKMLEMKDDRGQHLFYVVHLALQCDRCKKARINDCQHVKDRIPSWKSGERQKLVARLYQDNDTLMAREACGIVTGDLAGTYCEEDLKAFLAEPLFKPDVFDRRPPTMLITTCDPNGGGGSETTICTLTRYQGKYVVSLKL